MIFQKKTRQLALILLCGAVVCASASAQAPADRNKLPPGAIARMGQLGDKEAAGIYHVCFSPDGKTLATRDRDQTIRLWDVAAGRQLCKLFGEELRITDVSFSPDGKRLATGGAREGVSLWDTQTGKRLKTLGKDAWKVRFSADGKTLRVAGHSRFYQSQLPTGELIKRPREVLPSAMLPQAFSPDGKRLAATRRTHAEEIDLRDTSSGSIVRTLKGLETGPTSVAFSPDGRFLAVSCRRREAIKVWDLNDKKNTLLYNLRGHEEPVQAVVFSPDGRFLVSASWDKTLRLWELETGQEIAVVTGHREHVCAVAFSPDGRRLASSASGRRDSTALVWDTAVISAPRPADVKRIDAEALEQQWNALASDKAVEAYAAIGAMVAVAERSVPLLASKLEPTLRQANAQRIKALILQLDSDRFAERERATVELKKLRPASDGLLQKTLAETKSPEVKLRIETILKGKIPPSKLSASERRRTLRLIYALELIADKLSRELLEGISTRFPNGPIADVANKSLARLGAQ